MDDTSLRAGWRVVCAWLTLLVVGLGVLLMGQGPIQGAALPGERPLHYPDMPLDCRVQSPLNIVVVVVGSLPYDALNAQVMPHTWALAQRGQWFTRHFSSNPARLGLFELMYGLPGGYWQSALAARRGPVLIEQLQLLHYDVWVFGSRFLSLPEFELSVFKDVRDHIVIAPHDRDRDARDRYAAERLISELQVTSGDRRLFGLVFLDGSSDLAAAQQADARVGQIAASIEAAGISERTILVVTGVRADGADEQIPMPMVVMWPGFVPQVYAHMSSHEDLVPTLLGRALACSNPVDDYSTGHDLFSLALED